jgi:hypothetical protein
MDADFFKLISAMMHHERNGSVTFQQNVLPYLENVLSSNPEWNLEMKLNRVGTGVHIWFPDSKQKECDFAVTYILNHDGRRLLESWDCHSSNDDIDRHEFEDLSTVTHHLVRALKRQGIISNQPKTSDEGVMERSKSQKRRDRIVINGNYKAWKAKKNADARRNKKNRNKT